MENNELAYDTLYTIVKDRCVEGDTYDEKDFKAIYNSIIRFDESGVYEPINGLLETCRDVCFSYDFDEEGTLKREDYMYTEWDRDSENGGGNIICEDHMLLNMIDIDTVISFFF